MTEIVQEAVIIETFGPAIGSIDPNASSATKGITTLSVDPATPTSPVAVGLNDPMLGMIQKIFSALTGGTGTSLDGIATVGLSVNGTVRIVIASGALSIWQLISGTSAENVPGGIVRPDDYAAVTNEKIWIRVIGF